MTFQIDSAPLWQLWLRKTIRRSQKITKRLVCLYCEIVLIRVIRVFRCRSGGRWLLLDYPQHLKAAGVVISSRGVSSRLRFFRILKTETSRRDPTPDRHYINAKPFGSSPMISLNDSGQFS